ncbi:MAG TPA: flagellar basal body P-ring protein FlgI [Bdellovibrionota bacterium]|jgi:flagellar P-ring protein precursor FlgI|nr:flagellar basal body P-ring protein FlgI [Bdellovibrionota bacterium]
MKKLLGLMLLSGGAFASSRVKDLVSIKGVRENQLIGYGMVVGLKGTGDSKLEFTGLSMSQMLKQMGIDIAQKQITTKNIAAVVVTANLPPFARAGAKLDVQVSSIGDAKSLEGGTLLITPLRGADKQVYVVTQGPLSVGGTAAGGGGSSSVKNHPTVGMIPNGGIVEREVMNDFENRNAIRLALHNPDFTTAARLSRTINLELGGVYARARDSATVDVMVPYDYEGGVVDLVATIERLPLEPDNRARVIINERTGTIVVGSSVRLSSVAIAHGNLTLEVREVEKTTETPVAVEGAAMPTALTGTKAETVKETVVSINEPGDKLISVAATATLGDVVKGLNALGVTPRDLIGILQALKAQGALQAELEIL